MRASLSVQDFENVIGASGREGLHRTRPRWEKWERPLRADGTGLSGVDWAEETVGMGEVQGVASSWRDMVSSMLASPQGTSEQYMWIWRSSLRAKGWGSEGVRSSIERSRRKAEGGWGGERMARSSSRRKRLKARMARTSACQSWRALP